MAASITAPASLLRTLLVFENSVNFVLSCRRTLFSTSGYSVSRLCCRVFSSRSLAQRAQDEHSSDPSLSTRPARPNVVNILEERGLLDSLTSENLRSAADRLRHQPLKVYCGFDPTAESLHLGNLLGLIVLSWFLRCGHFSVALIGRATARVDDPSGKSVERPELDIPTMEKNNAGISDTISRILGKGNSFSFAILNNYDWWKDVKLLDFLKNVGKYARVGVMMS